MANDDASKVYGTITADTGVPDARTADSTANETTPLVSKKEQESSSEDEGKEGGLSVKQAALLIAGEMAGSGVLALPRALAKTGWVGVPVIILMWCIAGYGGTRLGECWSMIEERNPDMRTRQRNPYSLIAQHALGKKGSVVVSVCIQITLLGAGVVYLLMAAQIVEEIFSSLFPNVSFCLWQLILALQLLPALWLGTPKNLKFMGLVAFGSTVLACLFYFIQILNDVKPYRIYRYGIHGFEEFFLAFGTIMFAFGGASTFPTIQNDMVEKKKFSHSVLMAFSAILILYLPITIGAYMVYGEGVAPNFVMSLTPTFLLMLANILIAVHLVFAFVIILNPVFQELEEHFNVPHEFGHRRVILRSGLLLTMLFVGETIPKFSGILALVGGSTVALLTYVLPTLCYMKLKEREQPQGESPLYMKVVFWEIISVGAVGGLAATYSAFSAIFSNQMAWPCYLR